MKLAIITADTAVYKEIQENTSGQMIQAFARDADLDIMFMRALPLDRKVLGAVLDKICETMLADIVFITGGSGFGPEDVAPDAVLDLVTKKIPGIPEAIRGELKAAGKSYMGFCGVAGIKNDSLIINLPESPEGIEACLSNLLPGFIQIADHIKGDL